MRVLGQQVYRFEGVEVDPAQGCVRLDGRESFPRQKSFRLLLHLIEQRHRLVSKEELHECIWEGTAVTDDALVQLIGELRRLLGDDPRRPRFIKTFHKAGYRFIAPVEELYPDPRPAAVEVERHASVEIEFEEEIGGADVRGESAVAISQPSPPRHVLARALRRPAAVAAALVLLAAAAPAAYLLLRSARTAPRADVTLPRLAGRRALAVMYFENRSADAELDWLREGLADMLVTDFSRSPGLTVLSRAQLRSLLERAGREPRGELRLEDALDLARRARAEVVATGSFARLDGKVRIEAQLHDAATGHLLAAESLTADRPADILDRLDLLSLKLASRLGVEPVEPSRRPGLADVTTHSLEAYRLYSLAIEKAHALHNSEAVEQLERAVALDPQFAMAHARIGYAYAITANDPEKGKPYFERAFRLSDRLTEKDRLYITAWYSIANRDFARAAETFRAVVAGYPLEVEAYLRLGRLLQGEGRDEEAIGVLRQGLIVAPEAPELYNALGVVYLGLGRHEEAVAMHRRYVEMASGEPNAHDSLGLSYQSAGRYAEAVAEYRRALELKPDFEVAVIHLGNAYYATGRYREAAEQFKRYLRLAARDEERMRGHFSLAYLHLKKGDLRRAEQLARRAPEHEQRYWIELAVALARGARPGLERLMARFPPISPSMNRGAAGTLRDFYYWRGNASLKLGRAEEALEDFRRALEHRPAFWQMETFEDCLAAAFLETGRPDEAVAEYERVLRLNPNYPLAHYRLAQAYERRGQSREARAAYERFLQVWQGADADVPEVAAARERLSAQR